MRAARRTIALLAASLPAAAAASVGGLVATGGAAAAQAPPATVGFTFAGTAKMGSSAATVSGSGVADLAGHRLSASVLVPGSLAAHLPGSAGTATTVDVVLSGGTLYVSWPGLASVTGGKPWASVTLPAGVQSRMDARFTRAATVAGDVNRIVQFATRHHATVTPLGSSVVDGVSATGTQITAVLRHPSLLPVVRRHVPAGLQTTPGPAVAASGRRLTLDVWANGAGQLVRADGHVDRAGASVASGQLDLHGYGAPVSITVPPASQVEPVPTALLHRLLARSHLGNPLLRRLGA